jgi:hypothetical protein
MEALGYAKNKLPFVQLARRVPLKWAEEKFSRSTKEDYIKILQALLLGAAGLLPSQRRLLHAESEYTDQMEQIWSTLPHPDSMSYRDWELFKVRPANFPVRRIIALSHLLQRYCEKGWLPAFMEIIRRAPEQRPHFSLESAFMVTSEGYWARHYDFGRSNSNPSPVLLGRERAGVIVINVLLPFMLSMSQMTNRQFLSKKALDIFRCYPRLGSNSVERHMIQQLEITTREVNSARRQQGLIHIYQSLCTQGKCEECEFAH